MAARQLEQQGQEYIKLCEQMYGDIDSMSAAWRGTDNVAFVNKVNTFRSEFAKAIEAVVGYSELLNAAAKSYRQTQQGVTRAASSLPTSGGGGASLFSGVAQFLQRFMRPVLARPVWMGSADDLGQILLGARGGASAGVAGEQIDIALGQVGACAQRMRAVSGRLEEKLQEMRQTMAGLQGSWESDAAETVRGRFNASVAKLGEMRGTIDSYASFLDRTVAEYRQTEARLAASADGMGA